MSEYQDGAYADGDPWEGMLDDAGDLLELEPDDLDEGPTVEQEHYVEQVAAVREEIGGESPDATAPEWVAQKFPSLDWSAAYQTDFTRVDWLPGKFMERGQQVTLVGDGKVGKSLFALDWAFRMAAGRSFMGDKRHEPMTVLYFDRENSLRDIVTRGQALGAKPDDLTNLIYKQFPQFDGSLDASERAGTQLVKLAVGYKADVVILDTVSRFISGKENDSDTWLQLYQLVHAKLKARGIACLRLDHFGKDSERGSRGSSAKSQDVDSVWELSKNSEKKELAEGTETIVTTLKLARTHTRSGLGDDLFTLVRKGHRKQGGMWEVGGTRHEIGDLGVLAQAKREVDVIVDELILMGVPRGIGRDAFKGWLKSNGRPTYRNDMIGDILREMKARPE